MRGTETWPERAMRKVSCINCGNQYRVKEELVGRTLKCPHCGMPIRVGHEEGAQVSDEDLRAELLRLTGGRAKDVDSPHVEAVGASGAGRSRGREKAPSTRRAAAAAAEAPRQKPPSRGKTDAAAPAGPEAEPSERAPAEQAVERERAGQDSPTTTTSISIGERTPVGAGPQMRSAKKDYTGLVVVLVLMLLLSGGAVAGYLVYRAQQRDKQNVRVNAKNKVAMALAAARESDRPCREDEAVIAWRSAKQVAESYEQRYGGGEYIDDVVGADARVRQLSAERDKRRAAARQVKDRARMAEGKIRAGDFKGAMADLDKAKAAGQVSPCRDKELVTAQDEVKALLASEEIRNTRGGLVLYKGEWITPEVQLAMAKKAEIEEMKKKGLVLYEGKWITPEERDRRIEEKRLAQLKWEEEERKRKERQERELQIVRRREDVRRKLAEGGGGVVIDSGQDLMRWDGENWANKVDLELVPPEGKKPGWIDVKLAAGTKKKWVVSVLQPGNITDYDAVVADFLPKTRIRVALGVWTMPGYELFESFPYDLKGGEAATIAFDLKGAIYKCRATDWSHKGRITRPESVYKISFFIYGKGGGALRFKNVRLAKKPKKAGG